MEIIFHIPVSEGRYMAPLVIQRAVIWYALLWKRLNSSNMAEIEGPKGIAIGMQV